MAEIHAIQNGNWSDASTWDLGRVPDVDDDIYIGNYIVTCAAGTYTIKTLNFTGIGHLAGSGAKVFNCNINAIGANPDNNYAMFPYGTGDLKINGDIVCDFIGEVQRVSYYLSTFNGNFTSYSGCLFEGSNITSLNMNGNAFLYNKGRMWSPQTYGVLTLTINGKVYIDENSTAPYVFDKPYSDYQREIVEIESFAYKPIFRYWLGGSVNFPLRINKLIAHNATYLIEETDIGNAVLGEVYIPNGSFTKTNYQVTVTINGKCTVKQEYAGISRKIMAGENAEFINLEENATTLLVTKKQYQDMVPQESDVKQGVEYGINKVGTYSPNFPQESNVLKDVEYGDGQVGTLEVIALSGATATADNIAVVNLTEQQVNRVSQCATKETVDEAFKEFISESATIIDKASVITGDATVIKGDVAAVNLTREQIERIKNCATVSTIQRCFSDFKNKK